MTKTNAVKIELLHSTLKNISRTEKPLLKVDGLTFRLTSGDKSQEFNRSGISKRYVERPDSWFYSLAAFSNPYTGNDEAREYFDQMYEDKGFYFNDQWIDVSEDALEYAADQKEMKKEERIEKGLDVASILGVSYLFYQFSLPMTIALVSFLLFATVRMFSFLKKFDTVTRYKFFKMYIIVFFTVPSMIVGTARAIIKG